MNITESVIIYLFTIILSSYAFHGVGKAKKKLTRNICIFFAIGIPVFIAGVRYSIGVDYFTYINGYEMIKNGMTVRWMGIEKGYVLLNLSLIHLGLKAQSIMFTTAFIMMCFVTKALLNKKKSISVGFGALTFMLLFYQSSFNTVRIMIAVSIFLYNIYNIENRNLKKYLLFTVIAASFHISALITIPLYWLFNSFQINKSLSKRLLVYLGTVIVIIFFNDILSWVLSQINHDAINYYSQYIGNSDKSIDIAIKKAILYIPILIPGIFMYKKCKRQDENFQIYYSLTVIGVLIIVFATFKATYIDRISQYFMIATVMVVSVYMRVLKKKKNYIVYSMIICYLFIYWIYIYFIIKNHGTVPYQWIF
jgi:hypothetical protein